MRGNPKTKGVNRTRIGVPAEVKEDENRVALSPAGAMVLVADGHRVLVEKDAGLGSGFSNEAYRMVGAAVVADREEIWGADLVLKVKEPVGGEYSFFRQGQVLFTYLHLAANRELTMALAGAGVTAVAYETVQEADGLLPLLVPMSEVAGRMAPQVGAQFLEKPKGGRGVLLGGVPGVPPAEVTIVGGGVVGKNAARIALGMGASVTVLDVSWAKLAGLDDLFGGRVSTLMSNPYNLAAATKRADLLIGAVLIPGAKAPHLVTEEMVREMKPGAVIVDVAVDQGGSVETVDHPTTHSNPVYYRHEVVHYAVSNMPGAVARTSTYALTNVTLKYIRELAGLGPADAVEKNPALGKGVNVHRGRITHPEVARANALSL